MTVSKQKLGVQHVKRKQYRYFNIEWAWSKIFEFTNFSVGILELKKVQFAFCKATALRYKTRWRYKTKRLHTDFWPTLYL